MTEVTANGSQEVEELKRSLASQEEKNIRLAQALTTARQQLVNLQEQVRQVNMPPQRHFLRILVPDQRHEAHAQ